MIYKKCSKCFLEKSLNNFRKQRAQCIDCYNIKRRDSYKLSICRYCKIEFRPGKEGRYKFCNEKCRFLKKINIDISGCWLWNAAKNRCGYGLFLHENEKKSGLAHRASYRIFKKDLKDSDYILHICNITSCVNPEHLKIGNAKENYKDIVIAGKNLRKKLMEKDILKIRELYKKEISYRDIAKIFNVSANTIFDVIKKRMWKHVIEI